MAEVFNKIALRRNATAKTVLQGNFGGNFGMILSLYSKHFKNIYIYGTVLYDAKIATLFWDD